MNTTPAGFIESHFSRRDKVVLRFANIVAMHWPFGYRTVGGTWPMARLYWWAMAHSWAWNEIKNERLWGDAPYGGEA